MFVTVVYESMYGNTRTIAEAIARGLGDALLTVDLEPVAHADYRPLATADLLVVGAPTHAWNLSRPSTRRSAAEAAARPDSGLRLEPGADGPGLREWLAALPDLQCGFAAFDTHMAAPFGLSGSAARRASRLLRHRGMTQIVRPRQFLVTRANTLMAGEERHARAWGADLASLVRRRHPEHR